MRELENERERKALSTSNILSRTGRENVKPSKIRSCPKKVNIKLFNIERESASDKLEP